MVAVQYDKRLLWDPRQSNKFIVGGRSQLTLYEWTPEYPEIRNITSKHGLEHMKCFAWSPDRNVEDLIAVGYSTGRLDLIRLEASKHARQSNLLSVGPVASLPLRNSRACNALAFCDTDPNYLVMGLDKVRSECSLVLWDLEKTIPTMLFPSENSELSHAPIRPQPFLPQAELSAKFDRRIVQQHAPTEVVSALTFLPQTTHLVLTSMSSRWLRLFDLRTSIPAMTQIASKVSGMTTDPFDSRRVACFGEGVVSVWDTRKFLQPILSFSERDALGDGAKSEPLPGVYSSLEFSSTRRGVLATLHQGSRHVRMWDIMEARSQVINDAGSDTEKSRDSGPSRLSVSKRSWAPWSGGSSGHEPIRERIPPTSTGVVLSDTRRSKTFDRPLASFALVPPSQEESSLTSSMMVVNSEGDLELHALHDTPKQASWSSRGDMAIGSGFSLRVYSAIPTDEEVPLEPWDIAQAPSQPTRSGTQSRSRGRETRRQSTEPTTSFTPPQYNHRSGESPLGTRSISQVKATNLAATRPEKRSFSPASLRVQDIHLHLQGGLQRSVSRPRREVPRKVTMSPDTRPQQRSSSKLKKTSSKGATATVEDDISMVMRKRVIQGYGMKNPDYNSSVVQAGSEPHDAAAQLLSDLWGWISYSRGILCHPTPMIHGYDFSYEGLLSIWEGIEPHRYINEAAALLEPPEANTFQQGRRALSPVGESQGNFTAALKELLSRGSLDTTWTPAATTSRQLQRQVALQLIGWSLRDSELQKDIDRWESSGKISRAACWLVFIKKYDKAVKLLLSSEDETHHMMSGMLAALTAHTSDSRSGGIRSSDLREHCELIIVKLQDPYLRAMLTHLVSGDWSEVLEVEELIPFRERLAIAFQFLDDTTLTSYLRRVRDRTTGGDIDAIIVTGLTRPGINVLQTYVDRSGDVQTAAILASYVCPSKFTDGRVDRWLDAYRDLLDGFRLFHHRVDFDVCRGQIVQDFVDDGYALPQDWAPRQILIRCNYCNKTINDDGTELRRTKATVCPHCARSLPRCSVCLMTLSVIPDSAREVELGHSQAQGADTIDDAIVMCQTCRHGGHAAHIMNWFLGGDGSQSHATCAVANCDCQCADNM